MDEVNALIMCGGYSSRMQVDKCLITYHQLPQWKYLTNLLSPTFNTFISCRQDQKNLFSDWPNIVVDNSSLGPNGPSLGILSAFMMDPNRSWLVVACDLPLITLNSIYYLLENRARTKAATAFNSPSQNLPDPLITIWEPKGLMELFESVKKGITCPRKCLINSDTNIIENPYPLEQLNANTPSDLEQAKAFIAKI